MRISQLIVAFAISICMAMPCAAQGIFGFLTKGGSLAVKGGAFAAREGAFAAREGAAAAKAGAAAAKAGASAAEAGSLASVDSGASGADRMESGLARNADADGKALHDPDHESSEDKVLDYVLDGVDKARDALDRTNSGPGACDPHNDIGCLARRSVVATPNASRGVPFPYIGPSPYYLFNDHGRAEQR